MLHQLFLIGIATTFIKLRINQLEKEDKEKTELQRIELLERKGRKTIRDFKIIK